MVPYAYIKIGRNTVSKDQIIVNIIKLIKYIFRKSYHRRVQLISHALYSIMFNIITLLGSLKSKFYNSHSEKFTRGSGHLRRND